LTLRGAQNNRKDLFPRQESAGDGRQDAVKKWEGWVKSGDRLRASDTYSGARGRYAKISEITISSWLFEKFMEIYAIMAVDRQFGYKRGCFSGLNSGRGLHKTVF
jgi:hypothetical protein